MTSFPQIEKPCPYLDRLDTVIDGGFCRMCRRDVHDLTDMDEGELTAFLAARGGDTCVTYRMNVRPVLAMALIAASAAVLAAPDMALAANHRSARSHSRPRQVPVQNIQVVTGGLPVPVFDRPADPVPPPPPAPPAPPQKPD